MVLGRLRGDSHRHGALLEVHLRQHGQRHGHRPREPFGGGGQADAGTAVAIIIGSRAVAIERDVHSYMVEYC